ncbi:TerC family protein [Bdellovibrionota bacterium]
MLELLTIENLIALLTLTGLEIVLGIDNLVLLAILVNRLPKTLQAKGRNIGLALAFILRLLLLFSISWIMRLTDTLFEVFSHAVSGRDLILFVGGLFLIWKATHEIHQNLEGEPEVKKTSGVGHSKFWIIVLQIMILDMVFSLDSVITAVGMVQELAVMVAAIIIAMIVMLVSVKGISKYIQRHPTIRMLALAFVLLVGVVLVAEGFGKHIERGYIYFAMFFSLVVELLNLKVQAKSLKNKVS